MTETTKERIENARKRLDKAEKWELPTMDQNFFAIVELADEVEALNYVDASHRVKINSLKAKIRNLEAELAALKEKMRWRKQSEEPPLKYGHNVEVYSPISNQVKRMFDIGVPEYCYWRPLDLRNLPEEDAK